MKILELNLEKHLTSTEYNTSPHRFSADETQISKRMIPINYSCDICNELITFTPENFEKKYKSAHSNLTPNDKIIIEEYLKNNNINNYSFLDFYCPKCKQATVILFNGGPSGYWSNFEFKIKNVLVIKHDNV